MATSPASSMNTPLAGDGGSDGQSHRSTTRPADAGWVYGKQSDLEDRMGNVEGGTLVAARPDPNPHQPIDAKTSTSTDTATETLPVGAKDDAAVAATNPATTNGNPLSEFKPDGSIGPVVAEPGTDTTTLAQDAGLVKPVTKDLPGIAPAVNAGEPVVTDTNPKSKK